jgi:hypothetical protein
METRFASGVAQLPQDTGYFAKKHFDEREKSSSQDQANGLPLAE